MPTEINGYSPSEETALSSLIINEVDSNETFEKMKEKNLLQDNQLYLVTDELSGGGVDIPASDTAPDTGNYWLDTSAEGGTYYTAGEVNALLQNKAPAGQGYDGASSAMPSLYLASGTEAEFEALLDAKLATMVQGGTIQAVIYDPNIMAGFTGYGTLSLDSNYAGGFATLTCNFVAPSGVADIERQATIIKVKTRGVWYPWEWVNPPFIRDAVYRTTERYLGNPVYKKMDSAGIIWWSTDQSTWNIEAKRTGAFIETLWRNAAPTSNFPNQFLNIDVSKYSAIIVNCNRSTGVTGIVSSVLLPVYNGSAGCVWDAHSTGENYRTFVIHNAGTTDVGIEFTGCTSEGFAIPIQIFGLRNIG